MKKALMLYAHGLGDIIMLTPHLRYLYQKGYKTDLMCRIQTAESHLLDNCPYVDKLIEVESPWRPVGGNLRSKAGFRKQTNINIAQFEKLRKNYDWSGVSLHKRPFLQSHKIDMTSYELGLEIEDKKLEVFIPESAEQEAKKYVDGDFIFVHTMPEPHVYHTWYAIQWIEENLPPLRMINTGWGSEHYIAFDDINTAFAIMQQAKYRVLSSSVFVHACEAMDCRIDVINYGRPDRKVWPLDQSKVLHVREAGKWIK